MKEQRAWQFARGLRFGRGMQDGCICLQRPYLLLFADVGRDQPPHERIADWLGAEAQQDAFAGFEAFLEKNPPEFTEADVAATIVRDEQLTGGYILIAALAERVRSGRGIAEVDDSLLIAAVLFLQTAPVDKHAGLHGFSENIECELRRRENAFESYLRLLFEPSLGSGKQNVWGIHAFMRAEDDAEIASRLAIDWMATFQDMSPEAEEPMIDRLLSLGHLMLCAHFCQ